MIFSKLKQVASTEVKTCTGCKHYRVERVLLFFPMGNIYNDCARPTLGTNPVTGKPKTTSAARERGYSGGCGQAGHYWEAK